MEIIRQHRMTESQTASAISNFLDILKRRQFSDKAETNERSNGNLTTFIFREKKGSCKLLIYGIITVYKDRINFLFQLSGFEPAVVAQNEIAGMFDKFFPVLTV